MPRAGTAWYFSLVNDLWMTVGGQDARDLRTRYHLERFVSRGNAQIDLTLPSLLLIAYPLMLGRTYVHKTHDSPAAHPWRPLSRWLTSCYLKRHWFTPLYIYRDPRDVILSAYEYGRWKAGKGHPNAFTDHVPSIEAGVEWIKLYIKNWKWWTNYPGIVATRYEDFIADYDHHLARVLEHLELDKDNTVRAITEKYRPGKPPQPGTHFHKGVIGRFQEAFTPEQLQLCSEQLDPYIREMGYSPEKI
jgi:hypothetical protein